MRRCSGPSQASSRTPAAQPSSCQGQEKSERAPCVLARNPAHAVSHRNPVSAAYISSLESQISSLRDELATVYKTQGQNAQRLLAMNETLREKEELSRLDSEALRKSRDEIANLRRKVDQHAEVMAEKDRTAQASFILSTTSPASFISIDPLLRSYTTKSARCNSSSARSRTETRTSRATMRSSSSAGSTPNRPRSTR